MYYVLLKKKQEEYHHIPPTRQIAIMLASLLFNVFFYTDNVDYLYISDEDTHWCGEYNYIDFDHARSPTPYYIFNISSSHSKNIPQICPCPFCQNK